MSYEPPVTIAFFTDSLEPSGVGEVISLLSQTLPASRYRQLLICPDTPAANLLVEHCPRAAAVYRLTVRDDGHVAELAELVALLQRDGVQVFHNHIGATWEGDWGTLAARMAGVPVVVTTEHLPCVIERPSERWFKRRVNRLTDRVIAVSDSVRRTLLRAEITTPEQAITIQNDTPSPLIGTIGRMTEQKGHVYLLRAVPAVVARHPEARFVWIGDGAERSALQSEAGRLGVQEQVWFMGWQRAAWQWLPLFAFTVLPSIFEGLPLAALESMAAGRAVVGARVCGTMDAIRHGDTGLLSEPRDPDALAAAINRLLDHPEESSRMGERARRRVEAEFSVRRMTREHDELYQRLLAHAARSARHGARVRVPAAGYQAAGRAPTAAPTLTPTR